MNRTTVATLSLLSLAALTAAGLGAQTAPQAKPAAATAASSNPSDGATYTIDDVHSSALFRVHHLGAGQFWGRFNTISGSMNFSAGGEPTAFDISIATDSVDTGEPKLDGHLKSPDFFNSKEFPAMTFKSASVTKKADGSFEVAGDLSMHGVTKSITAALEVTGVADSLPIYA